MPWSKLHDLIGKRVLFKSKFSGPALEMDVMDTTPFQIKVRQYQGQSVVISWVRLDEFEQDYEVEKIAGDYPPEEEKDTI